MHRHLRLLMATIMAAIMGTSGIPASNMVEAAGAPDYSITTAVVDWGSWNNGTRTRFGVHSRPDKGGVTNIMTTFSGGTTEEKIDASEPVIRLLPIIGPEAPVGFRVTIDDIRLETTWNPTVCQFGPEAFFPPAGIDISLLGGPQDLYVYDTVKGAWTDLKRGGGQPFFGIGIQKVLVTVSKSLSPDQVCATAYSSRGPAARLTLVPSLTSVQVGEITSVKMTLSSETGIDAITAVWEFNPEIFEPVTNKVTAGNCPLQVPLSNKIGANGHVEFSMGRSLDTNGPVVVTNCTLGSLELKARKADIGSLLTWIIPSMEVAVAGNRLPFQGINATVVVTPLDPIIQIEKVGEWQSESLGGMSVRVTTNKFVQWWLTSSCGLIIFNHGGSATADQPYDEGITIWIPEGVGNTCTIYVNWDYNNTSQPTKSFSFSLD